MSEKIAGQEKQIESGTGKETNELEKVEKNAKGGFGEETDIPPVIDWVRKKILGFGDNAIESGSEFADSVAKITAEKIPQIKENLDSRVEVVKDKAKRRITKAKELEAKSGTELEAKSKNVSSEVKVKKVPKEKKIRKTPAANLDAEKLLDQKSRPGGLVEDMAASSEIANAARMGAQKLEEGLGNAQKTLHERKIIKIKYEVIFGD